MVVKHSSSAERLLEMQRSLKSCIQPGREKDREKMMQQKLAELGSHLQRLERCMAMLKAENDVLRQKQRDKRALEENVRLLRKRNAELATSSRRLEERVRALQERSSRIQERSPRNGQKAKSDSQVRSEIISRRRTQTGQMNNLNITFRRTVGGKSRAIDNLHKKCQKLTDLLNNTDDSTLQNASQREKEEELIRIIKIAAKERLQLEHELANCRMKMGSHLTVPDSECLALSADISVVRHSPQCQQRIARALAENQQLQHTIIRLREQTGSREQNAEEYTTLKLSLAAAQREKEEAEKEAKSLDRRVHSLENVVRDLQESAEHVTQLENQRKMAVQQLQQKQAQLEHLQQVTSTIETAHTEKLLTLQQLVAESEEKLRLEEASRLKLIQEVQRLREIAVEREKFAAELQHVKQELARQHGINSQPGEEKYREIGQEVNRTSWNQHEQRSDDSLMSLWARNGPIQVYIAKYNYDPFQLSPNENPEAELTLTAGDYVLVVGDMDEDGFFDGELIDGSQGLVPSNFIEKVKDEDLFEFHEVLLHASKCSNQAIADSQLSNSHQTGHTLAAQPSPVKESAPPCPRNLSLDKQLSDSVHISWTAPDPSPGLQVHKYHVLVDGETQAVVGFNERTKVTLEDISESSTCRVCVRCLSNRGQSRDAQCTMLVGKDAYPAPTELTVLHLSPTSAVLTWLPGNSNYQHSISINGQEVAVVRPSVFYHRLSELQPGTLYQGTVTVRSASGVPNDITSQSWLQHGSATIEFSTPVADQILGTETRQQSPSLMREVSEDQISILTEQAVFQPVDSVDGEEQKGLETDEEIEEAFRQVEYSNEADGPSESSYTDSSRTELSDIPEVEEDLMGSQDSQLNQAGTSQVAAKSPDSTTDRSVHSETDDHPREFHAEKPAQFDGKPLAAPTPLTPTIVMQNHATKQGVEEENLPSTHSTPTNISSEQPALDIHISRAFLTVEQSQQKNILNCIHLVSVKSKVGDEIIDSQDSNQILKTPPAISDQANPRLDPAKEALTNKYIESDAQPGNHVVSLPVSSYNPLESSNDPGVISGDVSPVMTAANSVRLFIALFDYHPATMSPNVDCIDEELSFREGQILKVFGHKDADGFYKGESNGRMGYIPCNLVCEVQVDNPELRQQLLQDIAEIPGEPHAVLCQQPTDTPVMTNGRSSVPIKNCLGRKMIAMYDYNPQELSPNPDAEVELPLIAGDIVTVYGDMDEDGFFTGTINNKHGLVPSNFLQPLPSTNYRHST